MRYPVLVSLLPVSVLVATTACSPSGDTSAPNDATVPLETPARPKPRPIARGAAPQAPAEPAVDSKARPRPTSRPSAPACCARCCPMPVPSWT